MNTHVCENEAARQYSIVELIEKNAGLFPDKTAIIAGNDKLTYAELYRAVSETAAFLEAEGVKKGSHVVSMAAHDIAFAVRLYAILGIGAVHIPVESMAPKNRVADICAAVDADMAICPEDPECGVKWLSPEAVARKPVMGWQPEGLTDECREIIFTTGTTGKSKGVMLSTHCLDVYMKAINPTFGFEPDSVFLVTTPMNHVGGIHRLHQCLATGITVILLNGIKDLKAFFGAIYEHGVTHTYLPPASVKMLITLAKRDLAKLNGRLKFIYTASAPFPSADIETLMSLLPDTHLHQGYGSSETGSVCNCRYNAPGVKLTCLGRPYSSVELKLLDEEGNEVHEPGKPGKACVKSDMCMLGYYKEPELTAAIKQSDGFIHTSDLCYLDEDGNLFFAGRSDDVINIRGFKVAPTEVEDVALRHPSVRECVCVPYDDRVYGRVVKMFVSLNPGFSLDVGSIADFVAERLEAYKVPKYIEEVPEIPKKGNGKIDRRALMQ